MARIEPFRTIAVRRRILDTLEPMRRKEASTRLRRYSVNEFCEDILWDYAQGKLVKAGETVTELVNPTAEMLPPIERGQKPGASQGRKKSG